MSLLIRLGLLAALAASLAIPGIASAAPDASKKETCRLSESRDTVKSFLFHSVMLRTKMSVSWCYKARKVTKAEVTCKIEQIDRVTVSVDSCQAQGSYLSWRGNRSGAFYASVSVNFSNCVFKYGCWQGAVQTIERWFYADGSVTTSPRGGAENV